MGKLEESIVEALIDLHERRPEDARSMYVIGAEAPGSLSAFDHTGLTVERSGPVVVVHKEKTSL